MFRLLFLLISVCTLPLSANSQYFIGQKKEKVKKHLTNFVASSEYNDFIQETDSTLTYLLRDSLVQNLGDVLYFDKKNRCYKLIRTLSCDECYQKSLSKTLNNRHVKWTKIDPITFFSDYYRKMILKTQIDKPFTYEIYKNRIPPSTYYQLLRAHKKKKSESPKTSG